MLQQCSASLQMVLLMHVCFMQIDFWVCFHCAPQVAPNFHHTCERSGLRAGCLFGGD